MTTTPTVSADASASTSSAETAFAADGPRGGPGDGCRVAPPYASTSDAPHSRAFSTSPSAIGPEYPCTPNVWGLSTGRNPLRRAAGWPSSRPTRAGAVARSACRTSRPRRRGGRGELLEPFPDPARGDPRRTLLPRRVRVEPVVIENVRGPADHHQVDVGVDRGRRVDRLDDFDRVDAGARAQPSAIAFASSPVLPQIVSYTTSARIVPSPSVSSPPSPDVRLRPRMPRRGDLRPVGSGRPSVPSGGPTADRRRVAPTLGRGIRFDRSSGTDR